MNLTKSQEAYTLVNDLLSWYDQHGRSLPWRAKRPQDINLYHTVVSEIMLQQTTVTTVLSYFSSFIERWPDFSSLAEASLEEVLHAWQGLGYYRRAKALWETAKILAVSLPQSDKEWEKLPGFGPYTVAAVRSIALRHPIIALDGNIKRIMARFFTEAEGKTIALKAQTFIHPFRSGDVNQALMDIGSSICTPQSPTCSGCPLNSQCLAYLYNKTKEFPPLKAKTIQPTRYGYAFICMKEGKIALERRNGVGLLKGGLMGVPLSDFWPQPPQPHFKLHVKHSFTHFHLQLELRFVSEEYLQSSVIVWASIEDLGTYALPTLMKKIISFALSKNKSVAEGGAE